MLEHYYSAEEGFEFLENKSTHFRESFFVVFGREIRDEYDIFCVTADFVDLMWEKTKKRKRRDREISLDEIYSIRGDSILLEENGTTKHHWAPGSRGGEIIIRVPCDFHFSWHGLFMNLCKHEEFEMFWERVFYLESVVLRKLIDQVIKEIRWREIQSLRG